MSNITREKVRELAAPTGAYDGYNDYVLHAFANAVRADFIKELLGMDVEPVAMMNPKEWFVANAFIWGREVDDRHPEYSQPVVTTTQAAAMRLQEREKCIQDIECVGPKEGALKFVTDGFVAAIRNRKD